MTCPRWPLRRTSRRTRSSTAACPWSWCVPAGRVHPHRRIRQPGAQLCSSCWARGCAGHAGAPEPPPAAAVVRSKPETAGAAPGPWAPSCRYRCCRRRVVLAQALGKGGLLLRPEGVRLKATETVQHYKDLRPDAVKFEVLVEVRAGPLRVGCRPGLSASCQPHCAAPCLPLFGAKEKVGARVHARTCALPPLRLTRGGVRLPGAQSPWRHVWTQRPAHEVRQALALGL